MDLSRIPHLAERQRISDLIDQRTVIEEAHAAKVEAETASICEEIEALLEKVGQDYCYDFEGNIQICQATQLIVFEDDALLYEWDDRDRVVLRDALYAAPEEEVEEVE